MKPARYIRLTPNRLYKYSNGKLSLYALRGGGVLQCTKAKIGIFKNLIFIQGMKLLIGVVYTYKILLEYISKGRGW